MTSQSEVKAFWAWFVNHASEFGDTFENAALLENLDEFVTALGDFSWEVGPGHSKPNAFTLSPAGQRDLLGVAQAIVDAAPDIPGWEFHAAKQAKPWEPHFQMHDAHGKPLDVDATDWRSVLLQYADGVREVLVEAPNLSSLPEDYRRWAAEIALDCLLGERCRLEAIDIITVVDELSARERDAAFPLAELRERIR